jgi:hypothetical protein
MLLAGAMVTAWLAAPAAQAQQPDTATAALRAAQAWLAVVDSGRYGDSWARAADAFRERVTRDSWDSTMRTHRAPLGAVTSRVIIGAQPVTNPPNAPPGDYMLLQFRTQFAGREQPAVETVVPMKDPDGAWRVSGYFIR